MHNVMICGAGKIGALITCMLAASGDYQVTIADKQFAGGYFATTWWFSQIASGGRGCAKSSSYG